MSRRKPGPYPPPFDQLPAAAAELAMGLGGGTAAAPLAIMAAAGGNQLFSAATSLEYAKDVDGFYVDSSGGRLAVDTGFSLGDAVGGQHLEHKVGAVVGLPANGGRLTGMTFSDTKYGLVDVTATTGTLIQRVVTGSPGPYKGLFDRASGSARWVISGDVNRHLGSKAVTGLTATLVASINSGEDFVLGSTISPTRAQCGTWPSVGGAATEFVSDTGTASGDIRGSYYLGRIQPASYPWGGTVEWAILVNGEEYTQAQIRAVVDAIAAGATPAEAVPTADVAIRGIVCGAIDNTNLASLAYIGAIGDGTPVTVVQP